jgi:hypothetical protein
LGIESEKVLGRELDFAKDIVTDDLSADHLAKASVDHLAEKKGARLVDY